MSAPGGLRDYGQALVAAEVTDGDGRRLGLDEGLERAVALLTSQTARGLKVMFIGNGASAAIGSHQALDYWKNGGMRAMTRAVSPSSSAACPARARYSSRPRASTSRCAPSRSFSA